MDAETAEKTILSRVVAAEDASKPRESATPTSDNTCAHDDSDLMLPMHSTSNHSGMAKEGLIGTDSQGSEIVGSDGTEVESESDQAASTEHCKLPPEIILEIGKLTSPEVMGRMARTCRAWHVLLLAYATARALPAMLSYGRSYNVISSAEKVKLFCTDSLGANKFRLVKKMDLADSAISSRAFHGGLVAICPQLDSLSFYVGRSHGKSTLMTLGQATFGALASLSVSMGDIILPDKFKLDLPALMSARLSGFANAQFITALGLGAPNLSSIECNFSFNDSHPRPALDGISSEVISKITKWTAADPDLLLDMLGNPAFAPVEIAAADPDAEFGYLVDSADPTTLWRGSSPAKACGNSMSAAQEPISCCLVFPQT